MGRRETLGDGRMAPLTTEADARVAVEMKPARKPPPAQTSQKQHGEKWRGGRRGENNVRGRRLQKNRAMHNLQQQVLDQQQGSDEL